MMSGLQGLQGLAGVEGLTVLLVEDEDEVRIELAILLEKRFDRVWVAVNGEDGLNMYRCHNPDLIVTDIVMPLMDGLEMAEAIHRIDAEVPVVVTTALSDSDFLLRAIDAGVDGYLLKPIDPGQLQQVLYKSCRNLLQRKRIQQQTSELELYHEAMEEEGRIVAGLMQRILSAEGLNDPAISYWLNPQARIGGDMVAACRDRCGRLHLMLADSTGHGLSAAINLLPLSRVFYRMVEKGFALNTIIEEMQRVVCSYSPQDRFVAATLVLIDGNAGYLEIWNGGNPSALWVAAGGQIEGRFASRNLPLGIPHDGFCAATEFHVMRERGGSLLLFSDGALEAVGEAGVAFGQRRIESIVASAATLRPLVDALALHLNGNPLHDDIALLRADLKPL